MGSVTLRHAFLWMLMMRLAVSDHLRLALHILHRAAGSASLLEAHLSLGALATRLAVSDALRFLHSLHCEQVQHHSFSHQAQGACQAESPKRGTSPSLSVARQAQPSPATRGSSLLSLALKARRVAGWGRMSKGRAPSQASTAVVQARKRSCTYLIARPGWHV